MIRRNFLLYTTGLMLSAVLVFADGGANHRVANTNFGVSGGNINDRSRAFCCSGTLGALVQDSADAYYILSNNHVLGRSGAAAAGEDISEPGLIDNSCRVPPIVADFTVAPTLGASNVDAAIAALRSGAMNTAGTIEDIGPISSTVAAATIGLGVKKSGRTSGLTTGSVTAVNASVTVQYQRGCGSGKKFVVNYTNQVVFTDISDPGDSGSLIVTSETCPQPVALLYAGSSSSTIGNPIGEVLSKVGTALGKPVSFVSGCGGSPLGAEAAAAPPDTLVDYATKVKERHEKDIMARPNVIGVGVGASDDDPGQPAIVVYIEFAGRGNPPDLPDHLEGVRVRRVFTDAFEALPSVGACAASASK